ncbi:AAEL008441-PA [Aedes aegypti]|uniref:AAEL008441-PA n=1 Tax=Aedes aegypti TaxID=7159 RepID=Q16YS4_AEDAE|nr:AAEL008441-PA [Aedes aegypti]
MKITVVKTFVFLFLILVMNLFHNVKASSEANDSENEKPTLIDSSRRQIFVAPVVCPSGQKPDHRGRCRPVWSM